MPKICCLFENLEEIKKKLNKIKKLMGETYQNLRAYGKSIVVERQKNVVIERSDDNIITRKQTIIREKILNDANTLSPQQKPHDIVNTKTAQTIPIISSTLITGDNEKLVNSKHTILTATTTTTTTASPLDNIYLPHSATAFSASELASLKQDIDDEIANLKLQRSSLLQRAISTAQENAKMREKKSKKSQIQNDKTWGQNFASPRAGESIELHFDKISSEKHIQTKTRQPKRDEQTSCRPRMRTIGLQKNTQRSYATPKPDTNLPLHKSLLNLQYNSTCETIPTAFGCFDYGPNCHHHSTSHSGCQNYCQRYNLSGEYNGVVCNQNTYRQEGFTPCSEYNYCRDEYYYDYSNIQSPQQNINKQETPLLKRPSCCCNFDRQPNRKKKGHHTEHKRDRAHYTNEQYKQEHKLLSKQFLLKQITKQQRDLEREAARTLAQKAVQLKQQQHNKKEQEDNDARIRALFGHGKGHRRKPAKPAISDESDTGQTSYILKQERVKVAKKRSYRLRKSPSSNCDCGYCEDASSDVTCQGDYNYKTKRTLEHMRFHTYQKAPKPVENYDKGLEKENRYDSYITQYKTDPLLSKIAANKSIQTSIALVQEFITQELESAADEPGQKKISTDLKSTQTSYITTPKTTTRTSSSKRVSAHDGNERWEGPQPARTDSPTPRLSKENSVQTDAQISIKPEPSKRTSAVNTSPQLFDYSDQHAENENKQNDIPTKKISPPLIGSFFSREDAYQKGTNKVSIPADVSPFELLALEESLSRDSPAQVPQEQFLMRDHLFRGEYQPDRSDDKVAARDNNAMDQAFFVQDIIPPRQHTQKIDPYAQEAHIPRDNFKREGSFDFDNRRLSTLSEHSTQENLNKTEDRTEKPLKRGDSFTVLGHQENLPEHHSPRERPPSVDRSAHRQTTKEQTLREPTPVQNSGIPDSQRTHKQDRQLSSERSLDNQKRTSRERAPRDDTSVHRNNEVETVKKWSSQERSPRKDTSLHRNNGVETVKKWSSQERSPRADSSVYSNNAIETSKKRSSQERSQRANSSVYSNNGVGKQPSRDRSLKEEEQFIREQKLQERSPSVHSREQRRYGIPDISVQSMRTTREESLTQEPLISPSPRKNLKKEQSFEKSQQQFQEGSMHSGSLSKQEGSLHNRPIRSMSQPPGGSSYQQDVSRQDQLRSDSSVYINNAIESSKKQSSQERSPREDTSLQRNNGEETVKKWSSQERSQRADSFVYSNNGVGRQPSRDRSQISPSPSPRTPEGSSYQQEVSRQDHLRSGSKEQHTPRFSTQESLPRADSSVYINNAIESFKKQSSHERLPREVTSLQRNNGEETVKKWSSQERSQRSDSFVYSNNGVERQPSRDSSQKEEGRFIREQKLQEHSPSVNTSEQRNYGMPDISVQSMRTTREESLKQEPLIIQSPSPRTPEGSSYQQEVSHQDHLRSGSKEQHTPRISSQERSPRVDTSLHRNNGVETVKKWSSQERSQRADLSVYSNNGVGRQPSRDRSQKEEEPFIREQNLKDRSPSVHSREQRNYDMPDISVQSMRTTREESLTPEPLILPSPSPRKNLKKEQSFEKGQRQLQEGSMHNESLSMQESSLHNHPVRSITQPSGGSSYQQEVSRQDHLRSGNKEQHTPQQHSARESVSNQGSFTQDQRDSQNSKQGSFNKSMQNEEETNDRRDNEFKSEKHFTPAQGSPKPSTIPTKDISPPVKKSTDTGKQITPSPQSGKKILQQDCVTTGRRRQAVCESPTRLAAITSQRRRCRTQSPRWTKEDLYYPHVDLVPQSHQTQNQYQSHDRSASPSRKIAVYLDQNSEFSNRVHRRTIDKSPCDIRDPAHGFEECDYWRAEHETAQRNVGMDIPYPFVLCDPESLDPATYTVDPSCNTQDDYSYNQQAVMQLAEFSPTNTQFYQDQMCLTENSFYASIEHYPCPSQPHSGPYIPELELQDNNCEEQGTITSASSHVSCSETNQTIIDENTNQIVHCHDPSVVEQHQLYPPRNNTPCPVPQFFPSNQHYQLGEGYLQHLDLNKARCCYDDALQQEIFLSPHDNGDVNRFVNFNVPPLDCNEDDGQRRDSMIQNSVEYEQYHYERLTQDHLKGISSNCTVTSAYATASSGLSHTNLAFNEDLKSPPQISQLPLATTCESKTSTPNPNRQLNRVLLPQYTGCSCMRETFLEMIGLGTKKGAVDGPTKAKDECVKRISFR